MREVKVNVYSVTELSGKARKRAIESGQKLQNELLGITLRDQLRSYAFNQYGIETSGFIHEISYSQNDGIIFFGKIDLEMLSTKNEKVKKILDEVATFDANFQASIEIKKQGYNHWTNMEPLVNHDYYFENKKFNGKPYNKKDEIAVDEIVNDLEELLKEFLKEASIGTYNFGLNLIKEQFSDEKIIKLLEEENCEFYHNGREFCEED